VLRENRNVVRALSQRRKRNGKDEDAMVEILTEAALAHQRFEIAMRGNRARR